MRKVVLNVAVSIDMLIEGPGIHRYVFSNSLTEADQGEVINGDWVSKVKEIINSPGKDIWLFGGANLIEQFMNENLVDELQLAVHPIVLGAGKSLFPSLEERKSVIFS